jgi:hypothetical protein
VPDLHYDGTALAEDLHNGPAVLLDPNTGALPWPQHLGEAQTCYVILKWSEFAGTWSVSDDREALRYARPPRNHHPRNDRPGQHRRHHRLHQCAGRHQSDAANGRPRPIPSTSQLGG